MKRLLLFDIDGTLLTAGGVGISSCEAAFNELFGVQDVWGDTKARGKTDHLIFQEIAQKVLNRPLLDTELQSVAELYLKNFESELREAERFRVFPGVNEVIAALAQSDDVAIGLETGNLEEAAWLKLSRAALRSHFSFGGFGSDSMDRNQIVRVAIERGKALHNASFAPESVVVIGDAVQDIIAGKSVGARTVALLTGRAPREELLAESPDVVLDDMSDVAHVVALLRSISK